MAGNGFLLLRQIHVDSMAARVYDRQRRVVQYAPTDASSPIRRESSKLGSDSCRICAPNLCSESMPMNSYSFALMLLTGLVFHSGCTSISEGDSAPGSSVFICDDGREIPYNAVCDGNVDCANGGDEDDCGAEPIDPRFDCPTDLPSPGERFVRISSGTFTMGSPPEELGRAANIEREAQRTVTLTRDFWLQSREVTQGEYASLMGNNPAFNSDCGSNCPVERVTWFHAVAYANALSASQGLPPCYDAEGNVVGGETVYDCCGYRLPTEAEWEYAARAGTTTATYGGDLTDISCNDRTLEPEFGPGIAWFCGNARDQTHAVGQKAPNGWGLYDMLGNVWEWTQDWYTDIPLASTDPWGPETGWNRVARGGAYNSGARHARAASRDQSDPGGRGFTRGFRLARTVAP